MTSLKTLWGDLVERRLWPVAVGLLVALVAVPVVLSRPGEESPSTTAPSAGSALLGRDAASLLGETKPAVSAPTGGGFRKHLERLARKNPFVQQARKPPSAAGLTPVGGGGGGVSTPEPTTGGGGAAPTVPTTPGTGQPEQKVYQYTASVKFGKIGKTSEKTLELTEAVPDDQNAVAIFLGSDGTTALFLVSSEVTARGDGTCEPSESNCSILRMKKGDVEFFEVAGDGDTVTTYELELEKIGKQQITSARPGLQSRPTLPSAHSKRARRAQELLRAKKIFKALDQLGL